MLAILVRLMIGNQRTRFQTVARDIRLRSIGGTDRFLKTVAIGFRIVAIRGDIVDTIALC